MNTMTNGRVLPDLSTMDRSALEALVSGLQTKLDKAATRKLSLKVSDKGAVSLYGMGRFPVTLYGEQWRKLFAHRELIEAFLADNQHLLSVKD